MFPHVIQKASAFMSNIPSQCVRSRAPKFMQFTTGCRWQPQDSLAWLYGLREGFFFQGGEGMRVSIPECAWHLVTVVL